MLVLIAICTSLHSQFAKELVGSDEMLNLTVAHIDPTQVCLLFLILTPLCTTTPHPILPAPGFSPRLSPLNRGRREPGNIHEKSQKICQTKTFSNLVQICDPMKLFPSLQDWRSHSLHFPHSPIVPLSSTPSTFYLPCFFPPSTFYHPRFFPPSTLNFFIPCLFYIAIFPLQLHNLIQQLMMKHFQMFGKEPGPIQHIIGGYFNVFIQWIINSQILRVYLLSYVCYSWELTLGLLWAILCLAVDECGEPRLSACHSCSHRPWPRRYARIVIEGLWILFTTTLESAISSKLIHEMYVTHHYYYAMIDSVMCFMNPRSCTYQNILRPSQAPCCFWRLNRTYFCTCSILDWEVWWIFWQLFCFIQSVLNVSKIWM